CAVAMLLSAWCGEHRSLHSFPTRRSSDLGVHLDEVRAQRMLGSNAGVGSTPSYFLNGHQIHLPLNEENLRQAITEELEWVTNGGDRKSTRLNSSHVKSSYAVFCWKKTPAG